MFSTLGIFEEFSFNNMPSAQLDENMDATPSGAQRRGKRGRTAANTSTAQRKTQDDEVADAIKQQLKEEISQRKVALAMNMFNGHLDASL